MIRDGKREERRAIFALYSDVWAAAVSAEPRKFQRFLNLRSLII
jgi:hypothetical protein